MYLKQNDESRMEKLQDGFTEDWGNIDSAVRAMFRRGDEGSAKTYGASTLLALEICVGARKTAFLDPNVKFYTWEDWKSNHRHDNRNEMGANDIGSEEISLTILQDLASDKFTSSVIVQVGILKDAKNKLQKHLLEEDRDDPRYLVKPCLIYTAEYLVKKINEFRRKFNISKENFVDRRRAGASWDTRLFHPLLKEYFRDTFNHVERKGWRIGSHHMRRIYVMATIHFFKDSAEQASGGKVLAQSVWMALVLGHMGSVNTTISYSNLKIIYQPPHEAFQTPPLELIKQLAKQVFDMQEQIDKLTRAQSTVEASTVIMNESSCNTAAFVTPGGKIVTLQKHTKRKFSDDADKRTTVKKLARSLTDNKIEVNAANLGRLGIGRELQRQFLSKRNSSDDESSAPMEEQKQQQVSAEPAPNAPPPTEDKKDLDEKHSDEQESNRQAQQQTGYGANKKYAKLTAKQKVISYSSDLSEAANTERHRRDLKKFPNGKVLEKKPENSAGILIPKVHLGPKLVRDVWQE